LRYAHHNERATLIAMACVDGLAELYDRLSTVLGTTVEPPPAHVTLYSRPGTKGIGLTTTADLERLSRPLSADECQQLARDGRDDRSSGRTRPPVDRTATGTPGRISACAT
jgi:hypothetical protein